MAPLPKYLSQDEPKCFFAAIALPRDRALFGFIYRYGLLVGEALMLSVDDVNFSTHRITIQQLRNGLGGEKLLWRHTAKLIRRYWREPRDRGPYLFTGREGPCRSVKSRSSSPLTPRPPASKQRSVHALRHSMAVHLLEAGRGIEYVAAHLGHENIQTPRIYAQITHPLHERVFRELEQHPKIVQIP
jgi:integrase/recombinase XerD